MLAVGFISAGLMTLQQSIGIILGANIGTTITAQIIAFRITQYSLVMVSAGFGLLFCSKNEQFKQYGQLTMGLGLVFFGMQLMSDGTLPLRDYAPFIDMLSELSNPMIAILLAAIFTGVVQSSSATTGIVIVLASQGFISLETGIALIFGANIGTCVTAMLAAIGKPREAIQAAMVHVVFNVLGVVIWFFFIPQLASLVSWTSPSYSQLSGMERLAAETPRQIANAHTIFNVSNTVLFTCFTGPLAWLVKRLVPDRVEAARELSQPRYLDLILLQTPSLAIDNVRLELGRLASNAMRMVNSALSTTLQGNDAQLASLGDLDDDVDSLHAAIITYLGRLSQENLSPKQSKQLQDYLSAANYIENIGDVVETNLVEAGRDRLRANLTVSPQTRQYMLKLNEKVGWAVRSAFAALVSDDVNMAKEVLNAKQHIAQLAEDASEQLSIRLAVSAPNRLETFRLESEIIEYLKRIYYFSKRIAKIVGNSQLQNEVPISERSPAEEPATI